MHSFGDRESFSQRLIGLWPKLELRGELIEVPAKGRVSLWLKMEASI
jgi:hypothetical protein